MDPHAAAAHRQANILHLLTLIESAARAARECICISNEHGAQAQSAPRLALANANGAIKARPQAEAAAQSAQMHGTRANAEAAALLAYAGRLQAVIASAPGAGEEHDDTGPIVGNNRAHPTSTRPRGCR